MADLTPSAPDGDAPTPDASAPSAPKRGSHRAPAKPQRVIVAGLIAIAAVVALLVAFGACGGGFDSGQGVINGTPGVTTPPATLLPSTSAPATTPAPTPSPTATPSTTAPRTTPPRTTAAATPTRTAPATSAPPTSGPKLPVDVFNGSTVTGLARQGAVQVRAAGWTVAAVGNWRRTTVSAETVFYGPGDEGSARRLARDLPGAQQVRAALTGMSSTKLTYVVLP